MMRRLSEPGPVIDYIANLRRGGLDRDAQRCVLAIREVLASEAGRIVMELLEKSTIETPTPILADVRALTARNAQSFIAHDLRRVMSDEFDNVARLEQAPTKGS